MPDHPLPDALHVFFAENGKVRFYTSSADRAAIFAQQHGMTAVVYRRELGRG